VIAMRINWQLVRERPGRVGWAELSTKAINVRKAIMLFGG
jgi:hypothetical protein